MRYFSILIIFGFLFSSTPYKVLSQGCYELVWSDEFNYNGLPDSTNWSYEVGSSGWGNNELQYYTQNRLKNARVEDSILIIEAHKESYQGSQYTSARLITYPNKLYWKYGKIEARIKLPYGQGIWPAFWMLGRDIFEGNGWPACGEIDIMELIGGGEGKDDVSHGTIHWEDAQGNHAMYGDSYQLSQGIFNDDFHDFTIEWNTTSIKWYMDGIKFHEADITPSHLSEFHNEFFILLNVAVGGNWPGNPNSTTQFPQQMMVDYVRVYQKNQTPEIKGKKKVIKAESGVSYSTVESNEFIYSWSVPADAQIVSGQGTHNIKVAWGCTSGTVSCELITRCDTHQLSLPVELAPLQISGKKIVEVNEKNLIYSLPPSFETTYSWMLPEGVQATSEMVSNTIVLDWGSTDGVIKVVTENNCGMDSAQIQVNIVRQLPYPDPEQPHVIPGFLASTDYDYGGEGIAYHDSDAENKGPGSRQDEGVDTEPNDGGENVGWTVAGEWLEYTIQVEKTSLYDIEFRVASTNSNGAFKILFNNEERASVINVPSTGSWTSFTSIYAEDIPLNNTDTLMRIRIETGDFNLGRMVFTESGIGIESNSNKNNIMVYPTAVNYWLQVKNASQQAEFYISDIQGRTMKKGVLSQNKVNVSGLNHGVYLITISDNGHKQTTRFVKIN